MWIFTSSNLDVFEKKFRHLCKSDTENLVLLPHVTHSPYTRLGLLKTGCNLCLTKAWVMLCSCVSDYMQTLTSKTCLSLILWNAQCSLTKCSLLRGRKKLLEMLPFCFSALLLFCLSHFTPSSSVPSSFSPRHSASGNAFKSPKLGKKNNIYVGWTQFVLVNSQTFSLLFCVSLSVVFLSAPLLSPKLQNRKTPFSQSNCCIGGWPTPTVRVLHMRSDGGKIFASSVFYPANWKTV